VNNRIKIKTVYPTLVKHTMLEIKPSMVHFPNKYSPSVCLSFFTRCTNPFYFHFQEHSRATNFYFLFLKNQLFYIMFNITNWLYLLSFIYALLTHILNNFDTVTVLPGVNSSHKSFIVLQPVLQVSMITVTTSVPLSTYSMITFTTSVPLSTYHYRLTIMHGSFLYSIH
jgi:hypothetical protein